MLSEDEGRNLLLLARGALESHFGVESRAEVALDVSTPDTLGGVFATLKQDGELRGCIGYVAPGLELAKTVTRAVVAAATADTRFPSVEPEELPRIGISISLLTRPVVIEDCQEILIGRDGVIVERGSARGLLLPQVATERDWDRDQFLSETCVKAGLAPDSWKDAQTVVSRFAALQFDESFG